MYPQYQTYQPQQQMMTPPTIRAEIVQVDDESVVDRFPVSVGTSQMFMTKSEDKIIVKTMGQNGPLPLVRYIKAPAEQPAPAPDFVTREDVEAMIAAALKKPTKKEANNESV